MRRVAVPLLIALSGSVFASGSLDDVAKGMLGEPTVQVALKVTPRQRTKADARLLSTIFRSGLELARAASKDEATTFKFEYKDTTRLEPADLTETQRRRARQIAIQTRVLDSLLTSDLALALDISPKQTARLQTIQNERNAAYNKGIPLKKVEAFKKKYAGIATNADGEVEEMADMSDEQFEKMVKIAEQMTFDMTDLSVEMKERYAPLDSAANARALRVLTPAQRTRLRHLQGTRFTG